MTTSKAVAFQNEIDGALFYAEVSETEDGVFVNVNDVTSVLLDLNEVIDLANFLNDYLEGLGTV